MSKRVAVALLALSLSIGGGVGLIPTSALALTADQEASLQAAAGDGSQALASEAAALAILSPNDWDDILDAAIALDPDAAALIAATMAGVLPVLALEIIEAADGCEDPYIAASVAQMVPAASDEIESSCPAVANVDQSIVGETALLARKSAATGRQKAAATPARKRVTIAGGNSELQNGVVPSPN